jgi:peptidoglycan/xylan/chitin deacetylase (PgdA/CDA1 family)
MGYYWIIAAIGFFLALGLLLLSQPHWILKIIQTVGPEVVYFVPTTQPRVALTLDDGPDLQTTPRILEILRENQVRATFFLISGQVLGCEDLVQALVRDGHELGNHMTADQPSIGLSPEAFEQNLLAAHGVLAKFARVRWLRPASGWYSAAMIKIAKAHGYRVALGSVFPYDTHVRSAWFAKQHILFNIRPGSIIVLHDGQDRGPRTVQVLRQLLPLLKTRGYEFVILSDLVDPRQAVS